MFTSFDVAHIHSTVTVSIKSVSYPLYAKLKTLSARNVYAGAPFFTFELQIVPEMKV